MLAPTEYSMHVFSVFMELVAMAKEEDAPQDTYLINIWSAIDTKLQYSALVVYVL